MTRFWCYTLLLSTPALAVWQPVEPRALRPGELPVTAPGVCDQVGASYVLTRDLTAPASGLFLAEGVSLDLNGHTLTYAAGYQGVANCGFEDGLAGWDTRLAAGATARAMPQRHPLVGQRVCLLPAGQELVSPLVTLPLADRAYYAMAAVASHEMTVQVAVEDAAGRPVECAFRFDGNVRPCCRETRAPQLGGGVVFALLHGLPAGQYRVRVKAVGHDAVIDEVDLRPALDVGLGLVDRVLPWAYYKCILDGDGCAFFDYRDPQRVGEPRAGIPRVRGAGEVVVRNGTVQLGSLAVRTWGLQSTAEGGRLRVENVRFVQAGINTQALSAPAAVLRDCRAETETPWIIDRHRQIDYAVSLYGGAASEVSGCELLGGQGQLTVSGARSRVHHNLLVNRQRVVNHYSLGLGGRGSQAWENRLLPEQGSGILVGREQEMEIHHNEIAVAASPPVNEYAASDYSVNAIRLTDYNAAPGNPQGWCGRNRIHDNRITVTGRRFADALPQYRPLVNGLFMSVGGDVNEVRDNTFIVRQLDPPNSEHHGAYALYIGGSDQGGWYEGNLIDSNVTPVWIACPYGPAARVTLRGNTFRRPADAAPYTPLLLGWYRYPSQQVRLIGNRFENLALAATINDYSSGYTSQYAVGWTLTVRAAPGQAVAVTNPAGEPVATGVVGAAGQWSVDLLEYTAAGAGQQVVNGRRETVLERRPAGPYTVVCGARREVLELTADRTLDWR
ncbi:MAG: hypothetical protein IT204_20625 [Fimbriimonadaceae bacterium]|nr:hypothetical protein [Fimbriimonadaceae bacterium]